MKIGKRCKFRVCGWVGVCFRTPLGVSINRPGETCAVQSMGALGKLRIKSKAMGVHSWAKRGKPGGTFPGGTDRPPTLCRPESEPPT